MNDVFETKARKVSADQVEILDQNGSHLSGKQETSGFKVVKMGPIGSIAGLLLLPIIIPIAIIGFFFLLILALFFGKTVFKSGMMKVIRR